MTDADAATPTREARGYWESKTLEYDCPHERLRIVARELVAVAPARVLDLGCSTGRLRALLLERMPDVDYWGCDLAAAAVASFDSPQMVRWDLNEAGGLPFDEVVFDAVAASGILEYVHRPLELLAQARSRLAPDGALVLSYANVRHWRRRLRALTGRRAHHRAWAEVVPLPELETLLERAGFRIERRVITGGDIEARPAPRGGLELGRIWARSRLLTSLLAPQAVYVCRPT